MLGDENPRSSAHRASCLSWSHEASMNEEPTESPLASFQATDGVGTEASSPDLSKCPFCRANEPQALWPSADAESFRLVRCRACELVYTVPALDPKQMHSHYGEKY